MECADGSGFPIHMLQPAAGDSRAWRTGSTGFFSATSMRATASGSMLKRSTTGSSSLALQRSSSHVGSCVDSDEQDSHCSEGSECMSVCRRIALAKIVLAEATQGFTPTLNVATIKQQQCKNIGAVGPLLAMIQSELEPEQMCRCIDTLAFMLLDKANRQAIAQLGGLELLLALFEQASDLALQRTLLECVCTLVKTDNAAKERVWASSSKHAILALAQPSANPQHLVKTLALLRHLAFSGSSKGTLELKEPGLLDAVSRILAAHPPATVQLKCCKLLKFAADAAAAQTNATAWHAAMTHLAQLLRDAALCEAALSVLSALAARSEVLLRNLAVPTGVLAPLLALLSHPLQPVAVTASCVLSTLSEGGLSREQLCHDVPMGIMLRSLLESRHREVCVAVLYSLNQLAVGKPAAKALLQSRGVPALIAHQVPNWGTDDAGLIMATEQLLHTLGTCLAQSSYMLLQRSPMGSISSSPVGVSVRYSHASSGPVSLQAIPERYPSEPLPAAAIAPPLSTAQFCRAASTCSAGIVAQCEARLQHTCVPVSDLEAPGPTDSVVGTAGDVFEPSQHLAGLLPPEQLQVAMLQAQLAPLSCSAGSSGSTAGAADELCVAGSPVHRTVAHHHWALKGVVHAILDSSHLGGHHHSQAHGLLSPSRLHTSSSDTATTPPASVLSTTAGLSLNTATGRAQGMTRVASTHAVVVSCDEGDYLPAATARAPGWGSPTKQLRSRSSGNGNEPKGQAESPLSGYNGRAASKGQSTAGAATVALNMFTAADALGYDTLAAPQLCSGMLSNMGGRRYGSAASLLAKDMPPTVQPMA